MKLFKTLLAATALFGAGTGAVMAQSVPETTFNVTITITESCEFTSGEADDIAFADTARSTSAVDATGNLYVTCSVGTPFQIGLDGGSNYAGVRGDTSASPAPGNRNMAADNLTANFIPYDLFQPGGSAFWGNASGSWHVATGIGTEQSFEVTARISAANATNVPSGDYSDTVTATIFF